MALSFFRARWKSGLFGGPKSEPLGARSGNGKLFAERKSGPFAGAEREKPGFSRG
jgi:hypothetical protein